MKKIGVVTEVQYFIPRVDSLRKIEKMEKSPSNAMFYHIKKFEICVLGEDGKVLLISPKTFDNIVNFENGCIIEYDDEVEFNGVRRVSSYEFFNEKQVDDLLGLLNYYSKKTEELDKEICSNILFYLRHFASRHPNTASYLKNVKHHKKI